MKDIIEQLQSEVKQDMPEFSESLHQKCVQTIQSVHPKWLPASKSANNSFVTVKRARLFSSPLAWTAGLIIIAFCGLMYHFNGNTEIKDYLSEQAATPIPISSQAWESFEQASWLQNSEPVAQESTLKGRSGKIYSTVQKMLTVPTAEEFTDVLINQDYSMSGLMVKTGRLVQLPRTKQKINNDDIEDQPQP